MVRPQGAEANVMSVAIGQGDVGEAGAIGLIHGDFIFGAGWLVVKDTAKTYSPRSLPLRVNSRALRTQRETLTTKDTTQPSATKNQNL